MDQAKVGQLIRDIRQEKQWTQRQLADRLNISDKTVSKWERGMGCPDLSVLTELAAILEVDLETLLSGERNTNQPIGGSMKRLRFYVCPDCGNLLTATGDAQVHCCGHLLEPLAPQKAEERETLRIEQLETEYYITSDHEMTKEHYIAFVALVTGDTLIVKKQYAEWGLEVRMPYVRHGLLMWYCTRHGLFYKTI